jgi:sulfite reductase (NADPH) flavoprotein alpha-component
MARDNLYKAKIKQRILLNKKGSVKNTYQIVFDIKGLDLQFSPGDCLGVIPENDPKIVNLCINHMQAKPEDLITSTRTNTIFPLEEFLLKKANISKIRPKLLKLLHKKASCSLIKEKLSYLLQKENKELLNNYLENHELWDILKEFYSENIPAEEICSQLLPLLPRLYSISSSQIAHPNEIHLTVTYLTYITSNHRRYGVTSHYLCSSTEKDINIYIHKTPHFCLPKDTESSIIMIGTGSGIAPYISFMEQKYCNKDTGKNWLFFGECNKDFDFYYEDVLTKLEKNDFLKITTAFSRDQKEKIYVQNRLDQNGKEIWQWIQNNGYIYVCGNASTMAKNIDIALLKIFQNYGFMTKDQAKQYLYSLLDNKHYLKDVY